MSKSYRMTTRRKLAIASWSSPKEGIIHGKLTVDATKCLAYAKQLSEKSGEKISVTHLVGRAVGLAMKQAPDLNGRIVCGTYVPHQTSDLAFLVAIPETHDLGKFKVCNIDQKSTIDVARELKVAAEKLRAGKDSDFEKSKGLLKTMPTWVLRPLLWLIGYLTGALGIEVKALGLEAFPFGAAIITSVGMFEIDEAYAPPTPFARVPLYVAIMSIKEHPIAENGQVVIRPLLNLMITLDHRFIDGFRGGQLAKLVRKYLENPESMDR